MRSIGRLFVGALLGISAVLAFAGLKRRFVYGGGCGGRGPGAWGGPGWGGRGWGGRGFWRSCGGRAGGWGGDCDTEGSGPGEGGRKHYQRFIQWRLDRFLDWLDASDSQRRRVHELKDRVLEKGEAFRSSLHDARRIIIDQVSGETPDSARVHAVADERIDALRQLVHEALDALLELHSILTPPQRAAVLERVRARHRF